MAVDKGKGLDVTAPHMSVPTIISAYVYVFVGERS